MYFMLYSSNDNIENSIIKLSNDGKDMQKIVSGTPNMSIEGITDDYIYYSESVDLKQYIARIKKMV